MTLSQHRHELLQCQQEYSRSAFAAHFRLNWEDRAGSQAFVRGEVLFANGNRLSFREYLDEQPAGVEKLAYAYHAQDAEQGLLFRYDNAIHRPALGFREHKHQPGRIVEHPAPSLRAVLEEHVGQMGREV